MDLSIVIPTLNEASFIETTLDVIHQNHSGQTSFEVILVDAGSLDETVKLANDRLDKSLVDKELKGAKYQSLNKGGWLAEGEAILFLDADSLVPKNFDLLIKENLWNDGVVGGAFEFQMDGKGLVYRVIELINRLRYRVDRRYFGDQGIFCKRVVFEQLNGYPEQPIMEGAYFCRALRKLGSLALIRSPILTSARRFEQGGVFQVFVKDTLIWIQFTLGLNIKRYAISYWKENEKIE